MKKPSEQILEAAQKKYDERMRVVDLPTRNLDPKDYRDAGHLMPYVLKTIDAILEEIDDLENKKANRLP